MATPNDDVRTWFPRNASKQLGAWDFVKSDVTLEILKVEQGVAIGEAGRREVLPLMFFKGTKGPIDRPLVLNKTNLRTFKSIYGTTKASEMVGKRITLYATTCQRGRETVDCVRIRPKAPTGAVQELPEVPVDEEMRAKQQRAAEEGD